MAYQVAVLGTQKKAPTPNLVNQGQVKPVSRLTPPKTKAELTGKTITGKPYLPSERSVKLLNQPERTVRCYLCGSQMAIDSVKQSAHGGYLCNSRKGCDERREMRAADEGQKNLALAMTPPITPKESALKALTPAPTTPTGIRITTPTKKEQAKFDGQLVRVTDERETTETLLTTNEPKADEAVAAFVRVTDEDIPARPPTVSATERDRGFTYELVERQGLKFVLSNALEAEGFNSVTSHLMGVVVDSVQETGEITHESFLNLLGTLAKAARSNGYNSLAFYISQCYYNETGKRVRGF